MCVTCGCSKPGAVVLTDATGGRQTTTAPAAGGWHTHADGTAHSHDQRHDHGNAHEEDHAHVHPGSHDDAQTHGADHSHAPAHAHPHADPHAPLASQVPAPEPPTGCDDPATQHAQLHGRTIKLEQDLLAKNQLLAERNRGWFGGRDVLALNLVSSPGSGKTSLLERTICDMQGTLTISVIEGDQATLNDAQRIRAAGANAVQINTGTGCHLDADMVARGLSQLQPQPGSVVMIENVGNLVCPALFDLGEHAKVLVLSVTEGEDKPIKYPHMFRAADLMLLNKIDLLPHLTFDVERCVAYARQVNPDIEVLQVSAQTGAGMQQWYRWIAQRRIPATPVATQSA